MKKSQLFFLVLFLLSFGDCKKEAPAKPEQILGTRYSRYSHYITEKPGSKDKKEQVALLYPFEEVTALEEVEEAGKKYFKVKTVVGKEGYALTSIYSDGFFVIMKDDFPVFRKPTITAGIQGEIGISSFCFVKENQGEWINVDCLYLDTKKIKTGSYDDVWIQSNDDRISKDPLLAQTAFELREGVKLYAQLPKSSDPTKLKEKISEKLTKAMERNDEFAPLVQSILDSMHLTDEGVPNPPSEQTEPEIKSQG